MAKPRNLHVQVPGQAPAAAAAQPASPNAEQLPTVPQPLLERIAVAENEDLIAMDEAERSGENRPEVLAALDAELVARRQAMQPLDAVPVTTDDAVERDALSVALEQLAKSDARIAQLEAEVAALRSQSAKPAPKLTGGTVTGPSTPRTPRLGPDGWEV